MVRRFLLVVVLVVGCGGGKRGGDRADAAPPRARKTEEATKEIQKIYQGARQYYEEEAPLTADAGP